MNRLRPGEVKIVCYDDEWPKTFDRRRTELIHELRLDLGSVHHFGSTAVKGCAAKPIIDIAIEVPKLNDGARLLKQLYDLGYGSHRTHILTDRICAPGTDEKIDTNLYVVERSSPVFLNWIRFRDALRGNPQLAVAYVCLKRALARVLPKNRLAYTEAKTEFIERTLNELENDS